MKIVLFATLALMAGCTEKPQQPEPEPARRETTATAAKPDKMEQLRVINNEILSALSSGDPQAVAQYIHPEKGITFSMYGFIDPVVAKHFTKDEFVQYADTPVKFTWGTLDGTGEPYIRSIGTYLKEWAYVRNFESGSLHINNFKGSGNSINNLQKQFPAADFTENYIPGSEEYSGMDWHALRLVFEQYEGSYFLTAVMNDRWTI